jgi:hypothetical protein
MPPDRLTTLRRQRALVAEHLAWLDTEILAQTPLQSLSTKANDISSGQVDSKLPTVLDSPTFAEPAPDALAAAHARADEIIANYAATERLDPTAARKGCLQLALALGLLGIAGVLTVYLIYY